MSAPIIPLRRREHSRQAEVRRILAEVRRICEAGLDGSVPLEEAVCTADYALRPAVREVLRAPLSWAGRL